MQVCTAGVQDEKYLSENGYGVGPLTSTKCAVLTQQKLKKKPRVLLRESSPRLQNSTLDLHDSHHFIVLPEANEKCRYAFHCNIMMYCFTEIILSVAVSPRITMM